MAKGRKTGGRDFTPGQSGNPSGRPALPSDVKEARALNRLEFERIVNRYLYMTADEIVAAAESPVTPAIDLMIASIVKRAVMEGDHMRCEFILKRMIGDPPERIEDEEDEEYSRPESMRKDP